MLTPAQSEHAERAARTYSAAADHYCMPSLSFWDRWGAWTVAQLAPAAGDAVLDLCCGAGASALAAARAVGPTGRVVGIDLAEPLLERARSRAAGEGLANIDLRLGDATSTGLPSASFDAVVCVFGVFFAADMEAFVAEMWRLVRPGGTLAITTWGPAFCEPANGCFWVSVRDVEPSLFKAFHPWDEITTPDALGDLLARSGISGAVTRAQHGEHTLSLPERFWDIVLGSGYRGTVEALSADQRDAVRSRLVAELRARDVRTVRNDVVLGLATRAQESVSRGA